MGHTNTTPNYNLPQFLGSDKPAWLTDVNNAMSAIDTAIAAAKAAADNAGGAAAALATTVGGHTTQLETLSGTVANQGASIVSQGNSINTISELIGNGTPTTTDHTLIGAINELNAKEGDLADLQTTDKSSLVAAINEAAASGSLANKTESVVNLDSYSSQSNPYTFPSDGYACTSSGGGSLFVYGSNANTSNAGTITGDAMLFVRKGMKCHTSGTGTPWFLPLT